jgi:acyl-coenzyme A thioesterase PaaI-like protein
MLKTITPQRALQLTWPLLQRLPGGGTLLGKTIGHFIPYTGNVRPKILSLGPGYAQVEMGDGRGVRNHLKSLHAMALGNLAEFTSAIAVLYGLPDDMHAILTHISLDYVKKGRGKVVATAQITPPTEAGTYEVPVQITNESGQVVVSISSQWKVGMVHASR